ncbi:uncharacterized protein PAC_03836 [Phialocephala subalpina]|uniref:MYND-type domain-containing protein n=1 Tax=Phialocephala subalpina TaxID=576137 RepID=A0A1L7WMF1_9HELO|nr:uncharacterized protein PAC_03836 [Phialocephala subalpina]
MALQELVRAFNNLPRFPDEPVCRPAISLHLVNPGSRFNHLEGPAQILSCPSAAAQAEIVLPMLLKAYINSMGNAHDSRVRSSAPWSWWTEDKDLANALETCMETAGEWTTLYDALKKKSGPKCTKCKQPPKDDTGKLQLCGGCKKAQYCSRDCQKAGWKEHKIICKHLGNGTSKNTAGSNSSSTSLGALEYYEKIELNNLEVKERLVTTGKDTPENIRILLGENDRELVDRIHRDVRMEVLLQPTRGSSAYAMNARMKYDENCPPWTPREASADEVTEIGQIRDMQEKIRNHMGRRNPSSISTKDMTDILIANFGDRWSEVVQTYQSAVNAMDQGVPAL